MFESKQREILGEIQNLKRVVRDFEAEPAHFSHLLPQFQNFEFQQQVTVDRKSWSPKKKREKK